MREKRAVIMARVSTQKQQLTGTSLESQIDKCRKYAKHNGFQVIAELRDAISGTVPIADRPAGKELYQLIDGHEVDAVIFYTNDRTARDEYSIEYLLLKDRCYSNGIELHYADTGRDDNTATGNIIGYIKAQIAAEEKNKIVERNTRGKRSKAEKGGYTGGVVRYGFRHIGVGKDSKIVIDPQRASVVKRMFDLYTGKNGHPPSSIRGLVDRLNTEGVPAPRGGRWVKFTVRDVLTSREYLGLFSYGQDVFELAHLKIIDDRTFAQAQDRLERNKQLAQRNRKREYLFTGHIKCKCGRSMSGQTCFGSGREYHYYACRSRVENEGCDERYIRTELIDNRAWHELEKVLNDDQLQRGLKRMGERKEAALLPQRNRLVQVEALLKQCDARVSRLLSEFGGEENEILRSAAKVEARRAATEREGLVKERDSLQITLAGAEFSIELQHRIVETVAEVRGKLTDASFVKRRYILDKLDVQLTLRHDDTGRWFDGDCGIGDFRVEIDRS